MQCHTPPPAPTWLHGPGAYLQSIDISFTLMKKSSAHTVMACKLFVLPPGRLSGWLPRRLKIIMMARPQAVSGGPENFETVVLLDCQDNLLNLKEVSRRRGWCKPFMAAGMDRVVGLLNLVPLLGAP